MIKESSDLILNTLRTKKLLMWNKKHFSSVLKGFQLSKVVPDLTDANWNFCSSFGLKIELGEVSPAPSPVATLLMISHNENENGK